MKARDAIGKPIGIGDHVSIAGEVVTVADVVRNRDTFWVFTKGSEQRFSRADACRRVSTVTYAAPPPACPKCGHELEL